MDLNYGTAVLTLLPAKPLRLRNVAGRRLSIVQGAVWVTQDGSLRDTVLKSGAHFVFDRADLAVIQALDGPALVAHEDGIQIGRPGPAKPWNAVAGLWRRLRDARRMTGRATPCAG